MKKLVVFSLATMFCLAGIAAAPSNPATKDGNDRVNCKRISIGNKKARIKLENGEKTVMPLDQLDSYIMNGQLFEKKVLYRNGKPTTDVEFMQLLKTKGDFALYRDRIIDPEIVGLDKRKDMFYIYKGDQLFLALDQKSMPNAFMFFGLKWSFE